MGRYTYLMLSVSMCVHYLPIKIRIDWTYRTR